jgi:LysM repeat protein/lysophospholipase L1-like esterase
MGDSHVQPDILTQEIRKVLQSLKGEGGRGFVFPYSTAQTYSSFEYKSSHEGTWEFGKSFILPPKVPLGLVGMGCRTADSTASFTLNFNNALPRNYTILRFFCKTSADCYDFDLYCDSTVIPIKKDTAYKNGNVYVEIQIPGGTKIITVRLRKRDARQNVFEFYGMDILGNEDKGLSIHSVGVGGARFQGVLYQSLLPVQLTSVQPDLVILDYGTNDYLYDDKIKPNLEDEIVKCIRIIRNAAPGTSILLTSTQDMYRRGRNLRSGVQFSDLIREIAKEQDCLFFDWFWISGGPMTMRKWQESGLSQGDMIHLGWKGAKLKGDLMADAVVRTMDWLNAHPGADSLVLELDSAQKAQRITFQKDTTKTYIPQVNATGGVIYHTIRSGETLGGIAMRYGVSVSQIKSWNGLHSDLIIAGRVLVIYRNGSKPPVKSNNDQQNKPPQNTNPVNNSSVTKKQPTKKITYVVKSGDTLWGLAKRYNTTVDAIKKASGMTSDKLSIGQKLIIPY